MPLSILSNISALRAARQSSLTDYELQKTYQRLSSGLRINTASDDAAGLAIADTLRAQTRIASVALRNANDGISAVAIGGGALDAITSILMRLAELAEQSANGTYSVQQRSPLQAEFAALGSEIERIAQTTKFNGISLISSNGTIQLQVGFDGSQNSTITIGQVNGDLQALSLAPSNSSVFTYSIIAGTQSESQAAALTALAAVQNALDVIGQKRGVLGAAESRLNVAVSNISAARENFAAAESRIRDVDVAFESANLLRLTILQQAGVAVLAQANLSPQIVSTLLKFN